MTPLNLIPFLAKPVVVGKGFKPGNFSKITQPSIADGLSNEFCQIRITDTHPASRSNTVCDVDNLFWLVPMKVLEQLFFE